MVYVRFHGSRTSCFKWQNAAQFSADVIRVFSEDIGKYAYHKIIVADARDGMEYPMITLDGGKIQDIEVFSS